MDESLRSRRGRYAGERWRQYGGKTDVREHGPGDRQGEEQGWAVFPLSGGPNGPIGF